MVLQLSFQASHGFRNASSYDTHRPSYPLEVVDDLLAHLQVKDVPNARIVDLGAGTGKFTELLAARDENYHVVAVEPHEEMRKALSAKGLSTVDVLDGYANSMPVESQSVDAVVAAQAFHWFATDDALEEIHRILIPGGNFGMVWNVEDYNAPESWEPTTKWEATMKEIMWSYHDQRPRFRHDLWRNVFDKQVSSTPFTIQAADPLFSLPLGEDSTKFIHWLHPDAIWERFRSLSQISVLEGDELAGVRDKAFTAMGAPYVEANERGELPLHGHVVYTWTSAVPGAPIKEGG
ncbi:MAG: hypothetical protein LQ337_004748 [Flavoplaca oasis]|nr:MAG: hypothetical protein LQ337_004748 [Flavoplaca oasis]